MAEMREYPQSFKFVRDTPNYRLFTAHDGEGKMIHLYLPANVITGVDNFPAIVSQGRSTAGEGVFADGVKIRCCWRDNDNDGNCRIHSAPGVFRAGYHHEAEYLREREKQARHAQNYGGRMQFIYEDEPLVTPSITQWGQILHRVAKLENDTSLLMRAAQKIIFWMRSIEV